MITNLNMRKLSDGTLFIQYQENGKSYDGSFLNMESFIEWLSTKIG